jgi:prevent-host-death family protein
MEITATEFKMNLGKYLDAVDREDVVITKNGKPAARLVSERAYLEGSSELDKLMMFRELPVTDFYDAGAGSSGASGVSIFSGTSGSFPNEGAAAGIDLDVGEWMITHDGEPVARLAPIAKKKKRKLGFMKGPGADQDEIEAIFESEWTEEDEEEWLNKI